MIDRNLARGLFLIAISLTFGITSMTYPVGDFSRAGPGLFPLLVSFLLLLVGVATVVRSRFTQAVPLHFPLKNISLVLGSLCGFALASHFINMTAGIVVLVFVSTLAGRDYSWKRNAKLAAGLLLVALAFWKLLGLQLPLY